MTYAEMLDKIQSAGAWFVGSFMGEFLVRHNDYNIANHKKYEDSFNDMAMGVLDKGIPDDDADGFGYKSI